MFSSNPYAQGGWTNAANPLSINDAWETNVLPQPSMLGALPFPGSRSTYPTMCFTFTSFNPCIMNSVVLGPNAVPYFRIFTNNTTSVFQDTKGRMISIIEWGRSPYVEVRDISPKLLASQWLHLSPDRRTRCIEIRGKRYSWIPEDNYICLYTHSSHPELMARVSRSRGAATLEITTAAIQIGLLESAVVSTVLMQSGRNID